MMHNLPEYCYFCHEILSFYKPFMSMTYLSKTAFVTIHQKMRLFLSGFSVHFVDSDKSRIEYNMDERIYGIHLIIQFITMAHILSLHDLMPESNQ